MQKKGEKIHLEQLLLLSWSSATWSTYIKTLKQTKSHHQNCIQQNHNNITVTVKNESS
jgi:hypothetical protein